MPLSDLQVRSAKAADDRTIKLSDGGGLQLWVTPTGSKLWHLAYRYGGRQKKLAFGPYPGVALKDARDGREAAKKLLQAGIDPSQQKKLVASTKASQNANTFELIANELIAKKEREGLAEATLVKIRWVLSLARPGLAKRPISEIKAPEVLSILRMVEARGRYETAKRLRARIGECFRYAIATDRADTDPTYALRGALTAVRPTHRAALTDPEAFGGLLGAIDGYEGTPEVKLALGLLALTFVRPGELRHAAWDEFDLEARVWSIPATRMKMRKPHKVPLAPQTVALLRTLQSFSSHAPFLFPSIRSNARPISENTINAAIRRLGFTKDEMTGHGFRAVASSQLNESGKWNPDAIEAQLAHVDANAVRKAYHRASYWDERVKMMTWWADLLGSGPNNRIPLPSLV